MNHRDLILSQFEPDIIAPLLEFGKSIAHIDADILLFMARKSLCLYDVLVRLGVPPAQQCIVTDRVLDMNLAPLMHKRIALIDDTLILGSTLATTKQLLQKRAHANVEVHVFAADRKNWAKHLIRPDRLFLELPHDKMMTLCTAEVRALALAQRPYIVDFPLTNFARIGDSHLDRLLSNTEWYGHRINNEEQRKNGLGLFTFLLSPLLTQQLKKRWGEEIVSCIEIAKVRVFSRRYRDFHWLQIVPIITFRPLKDTQVAMLLTRLLDRVGEVTGRNFKPLIEMTQSPCAKQRLIQYICSAALGVHFQEFIKEVQPSDIAFSYDHSEAARHFGPWHYEDLKAIGEAAFNSLNNLQRDHHQRIELNLTPAPLPETYNRDTVKTLEEISQVLSPLTKLEKQSEHKHNFHSENVDFEPRQGVLFADESSTLPSLCVGQDLANLSYTEANLKEQFGMHESKKSAHSEGGLGGNIPPELSLNIIIELNRIFIALHRLKEEPARKEAQESKVADLENQTDHVLGTNRLANGLTWASIIEYINHRHNIPPTETVSDLVSLAIDYCNDLGVAVPITCITDNVVFRAYRYGEDVLFADNELSLAYEALKGYVHFDEEAPIPRLVIEKFLSLFIQVGAASGFLNVIHGMTGTDGTASIKFDLKGAVPKLMRGPQSYADGEQWLSSYMCERGVMKSLGGGKYTLGESIDANHIKSNGPTQAFMFGNVMRALGPSGARVLDDTSLIILATCALPRHMAGALQTELTIFRKWFFAKFNQRVRKLNWEDPVTLYSVMEGLWDSNGKAYEAVTSGKFKYCAYFGGEHASIVDRCAQALESDPTTFMQGLVWRDYWKSINSSIVPVHEKKVFDKLLHRCVFELWKYIAAIVVLDAALNAGLRGKASNDEKIQRRINGARLASNRLVARLEEHSQSLIGMGLACPSVVTRMTVDARALWADNNANPQLAFDHALDVIQVSWPGVNDLIEQIDSVLTEFGKLSNRIDYKYMLQYDTLDSKGNKINEESVTDYRSRLENFQKASNHALHRLNWGSSSDVFLDRGGKFSEDDGKMVFFAGKESRRLMERVMGILVSQADTFRIRLRIALVGTDFVDSFAYIENPE